MNVNTVANVLLIAAAVVWILWKQIQPAPIKTRLLVLAPLIMGYFGIKDTPGSTWSSGADVTLILIGAVFSIGLGLARGATIRVWREQDGQLWRQGSRYTMFLWAALLLVRVIMAGVATATHHRAATGLGPNPVLPGPNLRRPKRRHRPTHERPSRRTHSATRRMGRQQRAIPASPDDPDIPARPGLLPLPASAADLTDPVHRPPRAAPRRPPRPPSRPPREPLRPLPLTTQATPG